jgi:hypothetical protein
VPAAFAIAYCCFWQYHQLGHLSVWAYGEHGKWVSKNVSISNVTKENRLRALIGPDERQKRNDHSQQISVLNATPAIIERRNGRGTACSLPNA